MKQFDLEDVFLLSEIIDKMGLNIESGKLAKTIQTEKLENGDDVAKLGKEVLVGIVIDFGTKFIKSLYKAREEVLQLISSLSEKKLEAVKKMKLKELKDFFNELVQNEGFKDFLSQAGESEK